MTDIVPPEIPVGQVVEFTDAQLRQVFDRIELIDQHFERCFAFQMDRCHYNGEYNELYKVLHLAGVPEHVTPFERDDLVCQADARLAAEKLAAYAGYSPDEYSELNVAAAEARARCSLSDHYLSILARAYGLGET